MYPKEINVECKAVIKVVVGLALFKEGLDAFPFWSGSF
jgi:hypothetical protein